uniref:non-specific serine/threonine protein kinase n=1 Tax=Cajanus cajan TaxID=3821 RepID=A0A151RKU1_CAJCA|nr:Cysteine-rich receptor-like protein kinase 10 [Cajanus cajan]
MLYESVGVAGIKSVGLKNYETYGIPISDLRKDRKAVVAFARHFGAECFIPFFFGLEKSKTKENIERQMADLDLPLFDLLTIITATGNFSLNNKIGQGGFGPVYKGKLADGSEIAVKRLSSSSGQGITEFITEVKLIAKLQHRNLVKLLGCCIHGEEKILTYEYMVNGSLDSFIFDQMKGKLLDWPRRFQIIFGVARGLLYLHQDSRLRIIHRDLKASNVLLDEKLNPKISDFGMARAFGGDQIEGNTNRVVGTYGYMAPEYAVDGLFSIKSDVFSFGILLLEIVCGNKNRALCHGNQTLNLVGYAWKLWKEQNASQLIDSNIKDSCVIPEVLRCIHISLLCVQQYPEDRPTMTSVIQMLGSEMELVEPKEPGFFPRRISDEGNLNSNKGNLDSNLNERNGQEIAVKRLSSSYGQGITEFITEVKLIAKLQHRNLVKLLGCCIKGQEKLLVYEYMVNGSLDSSIFDQIKGKFLVWPRRFQIIFGIARGLLYLHQDSRLRIIHRDLKASNVLLDEKLNQKISDFGIARAFGGDQTEGNTNRVVGTYGYMAPEYAVDGIFSIKSDVFSFGILLLEIICGTKNRALCHGNQTLNLVGYVNTHVIYYLSLPMLKHE